MKQAEKTIRPKLAPVVYQTRRFEEMQYRGGALVEMLRVQPAGPISPIPTEHGLS